MCQLREVRSRLRPGTGKRVGTGQRTGAVDPRTCGTGTTARHAPEVPPPISANSGDVHSVRADVAEEIVTIRAQSITRRER